MKRGEIQNDKILINKKVSGKNKEDCKITGGNRRQTVGVYLNPHTLLFKLMYAD